MPERIPTDDHDDVRPNATNAVRTATAERVSFVEGLLSELVEQKDRYLGLVSQEQSLQAKITICERNLQATRDFIHSQFENTEEDLPQDWESHLAAVQFVGMRIGDACVHVLRAAAENGETGLTSDEILNRLNSGQFRFRTGFPLREIHGALMRNQKVSRERDTWKLTPDSGQTDRSRVRIPRMHRQFLVSPRTMRHESD